MIILRRYPSFFPPKETSFTLITPNNEKVSVKLCQDNAMAIMSNPNTALANWLLKTALSLQENEMATYQRMRDLGFDSVIISKLDSRTFSIVIMPLDSYECFKNRCEHRI